MSRLKKYFLWLTREKLVILFLTIMTRLNDQTSSSNIVPGTGISKIRVTRLVDYGRITTTFLEFSGLYYFKGPHKRGDVVVETHCPSMFPRLRKQLTFVTEPLSFQKQCWLDSRFTRAELFETEHVQMCGVELERFFCGLQGEITLFPARLICAP